MTEFMLCMSLRVRIGPGEVVPVENPQRLHRRIEGTFGQLPAAAAFGQHRDQIRGRGDEDALAVQRHQVLIGSGTLTPPVKTSATD